jgi:U2-associated protein SR140
MQREEGNADYDFLFNSWTKAHFYYRWKIYSLLQGDNETNWRTDPFQM